MNARLEEAAQIATQYLSSLENLPQEAKHLLEEIKYLDASSEKLTDMIATETQDYLHHSHQNAGRATLPTGKDVARAIPATVSRMYDEVNALAAEKVALSGRLVNIFERAMARVQHDLQRILELEGDEPGLPPTQDFLASIESTMRQINGLRAAAAQEIGPIAPPAASSSTSAPSAQKKRKTAALTGSGKGSSSVPVASGRRNTSQKSVPSRVVQSRQTRMRPQSTAVPAKRLRSDSDEGEDKENEHESSDGEDNTPYCYCGDVAWGEMIACEKADCPNEWFHLSCAGLKPPLPDVWYCDDCRRNLDVPRTDAPAVPGPSVRKGRKKQ